jgi:hypothetical protein
MPNDRTARCAKATFHQVPNDHVALRHVVKHAVFIRQLAVRTPCIAFRSPLLFELRRHERVSPNSSQCAPATAERRNIAQHAIRNQVKKNEFPLVRARESPSRGFASGVSAFNSDGDILDVPRNLLPAKGWILLSPSPIAAP